LELSPLFGCSLKEKGRRRSGIDGRRSEIDGVTIEDAWPNRKLATLEGLEIPCL